MNRKKITILTTLILMFSFSLLANGNTQTDENNTELKFRNSALNSYLLAQADETTDGEAEKANPRKLKKAKESFRDGKSPLIASGLSLLLPGAGEIYGESYWRAGIFLGVEIGMWTGYYIYDTDGDDRTEEFHNYANANFDENRYFGGILQFFDPEALEEAGIDYLNTNYISNRSNWENVAHLIEVDSLVYATNGYTDFTHELPATKTQQYYEMIGKYHQYAMGWDDFTGFEDGSTSILTDDAVKNYLSYKSYKQEEIYEDMRYEANLAYEAGQNFLMISVLNHVASAFDAAYVIKSKYRIETKIRVDKKDSSKDIGANNFKVAYIVNF